MHNSCWCAIFICVSTSWSSALEVVIVADATVPPNPCRLNRPPEPCVFDPARSDAFVRTKIFAEQRYWSCHAMLPCESFALSVAPGSGFVMRLSWREPGVTNWREPKVKSAKFYDLTIDCQPYVSDQSSGSIGIANPDESAPGCVSPVQFFVTMLDNKQPDGKLVLSELMPFLRILIRRASNGDVDFKREFFVFHGVSLHIKVCDSVPYFERDDDYLAQVDPRQQRGPKQAAGASAAPSATEIVHAVAQAFEAFILGTQGANDEHLPVRDMAWREFLRKPVSPPHERIKPFN